MGPVAAAVSEMPSSFGAHFPGRKGACGHHLSAAKLRVPAGAQALLAPQIRFRTRFRDPRLWRPRLAGRGLARPARSRWAGGPLPLRLRDAEPEKEPIESPGEFPEIRERAIFANPFPSEQQCGRGVAGVEDLHV